MTIPTLKRIKIGSAQELESWLAQQPAEPQSVMLVTFNAATSDKHVSRETVQAALALHGWRAGRRYTLNGHLIGHVVSRD